MIITSNYKFGIQLVSNDSEASLNHTIKVLTLSFLCMILLILNRLKMCLPIGLKRLNSIHRKIGYTVLLISVIREKKLRCLRNMLSF